MYGKSVTRTFYVPILFKQYENTSGCCTDQILLHN